MYQYSAFRLSNSVDRKKSKPLQGQGILQEWQQNKYRHTGNPLKDKTIMLLRLL
jgi:hypothetical protein